MDDKLKKLILLMEVKNEEKFSDFSKSIEQLDKQDIELSNDIVLLYKELSKIEDGIKSFDVSEQIKELKSDIENIQLQKGDKGDKGDSGKDGLNGKDGRDGLDGLNGKDGERGDKGDSGSPDTPEQIVEKINTLEGVIELKTIKDFPVIEGTADIKRQVDTIGNQVLRLLSKQPQTVDLSAYVPNTRTLTINGTSYDLSANRTWTIAVPTKTSDLTNDSGFITSSALSNYVAKTGNETIAGLKTFSSDIYGTKDANRAFRVGSLSGGDNNIWLGSSAINPTYANFIISTAVNNAYTIFSSPAGSRMYFGINNSYLFNVSSSGAYFGSTLTSATARLHISAGSATAGTAPIKLTTGTLNTTAEAGAIEYNNTFHVTNSDATRRHIVTAQNATKVTASAPYTNDGYITINIGGTNFKVMTTA